MSLSTGAQSLTPHIPLKMVMLLFDALFESLRVHEYVRKLYEITVTHNEPVKSFAIAIIIINRLIRTLKIEDVYHIPCPSFFFLELPYIFSSISFLHSSTKPPTSSMSKKSSIVWTMILQKQDWGYISYPNPNPNSKHTIQMA